MTSPTSGDSELFAGIDGGGSTTRAIVASADGTIFGVGRAEGCNPSQLGITAARENLRSAFTAAWQYAGLTSQTVSAAFCGIAGVRAFAAQAAVDPLWQELFPGLNPGAVAWDHDLRIALAGGLSGKPGIVLIAGTGSACYARDENGATTQVGGWGPLIDDAGSGYSLGLQLLREAVRAWEERAPRTAVIGQLEDAENLRDPAAALQWTRSFAEARPQIARLAQLVLRAWREGDPSATRWVEEGTQQLAWMVATAAERIFAARSVEAIFVGGLSQNSEYFEKVRGALKKLTNVNLCRPALSPTAGALLLALEQRKITPSAELLKKLRNLSGEPRVELK